MNVKVPAVTARATPACTARADTAPSTRVLPELVLEPITADAPGLIALAVAAGELDEGVARLGDNTDENATVAPLVVENTAEEDADVDDVDKGALELELLPGAATAEFGSVRAPVPQGIASPSGWIALDGGTVVPAALAMAKRPVQVWLGEAGELNW